MTGMDPGRLETIERIMLQHGGAKHAHNTPAPDGKVVVDIWVRQDQQYSGRFSMPSLEAATRVVDNVLHPRFGRAYCAYISRPEAA